MAEQRPYRVPGFSADARLARAKRLAVLSLAAAFIAINWVTTQHAANVLRDASWLGRPLFHLRGEAIYAPWSWIVWWTRWYWAPQLEPLWEQCAREALYPMAIVTAVCCGAIAMVRHGWFANVSDLHGSARWATTRDLRAARLIDAHSTVRDRLREIGVRMRILSQRCAEPESISASGGNGDGLHTYAIAALRMCWCSPQRGAARVSASWFRRCSPGRTRS